MTREERLELLKQIEEDIYVCSLESTFLEDAKSCAIHSAIEELEQKPKTGHWIEKAEEYYKAINEKGCGVNENTPYFTDDIACPECLAKFSVIDNETERFDYCPNCGAKMESEAADDKRGED